MVLLGFSIVEIICVQGAPSGHGQSGGKMAKVHLCTPMLWVVSQLPVAQLG